MIHGLFYQKKKKKKVNGLHGSIAVLKTDQIKEQKKKTSLRLAI